MHILPDITRTPASSTELSELRDALSHADVVEAAPELRGSDFLKMRHPDLDAYRAAKFREAACQRRPTLNPKHPHKHLADAREIFRKLKAEYERRCANREQGGIWRIVDAYFHMNRARSDVIALEYQATRLRAERRAARDREAIEHARRIVTIPARDRMVGVPRHV